MDRDAIRGEQPVQIDEGGTDANYCPSCGAELQDEHTGGFVLDELVNRYRSPFQCPACGYRGEVIRHRLDTA